MQKKDGLKLNLGCGTTAPEGWINVDFSPNVILSKLPFQKIVKLFIFKARLMSKEGYEAKYPPNIVFCNLEKSFPGIKQASCSVLYSSHFFEYISYESAVKLLKKCFLILSSGGIFRIAVPDLYVEAKQYVSRIEEAIKMEKNNWKASEEFISRLFEKSSRHSHKWMYDFYSLSHILENAGFINIKKKEFLQSDINGIEEVEKRKDSLFIECNKP